MSTCCSKKSHPSSSHNCLQCDTHCKSVEMRTVYHQIKFPELLNVTADIYFYSPNSMCSIGYYSSEDNIIPKEFFRTYDDIKNNKLCYCFNVYADQYIDALKDKKAEPVKNFILQKTKSGDCACDIRNPSGLCCLAQFKKLEKSGL